MLLALSARLFGFSRLILFISSLRRLFDSKGTNCMVSHFIPVSLKPVIGGCMWMKN